MKTHFDDLLSIPDEETRKRAIRDRLEQLLLEGLDSGPTIPVDREYFQRKAEEWKLKYKANDS